MLWYPVNLEEKERRSSRSVLGQIHNANNSWYPVFIISWNQITNRLQHIRLKLIYTILNEYCT
jgi:hypothetical protein